MASSQILRSYLKTSFIFLLVVEFVAVFVTVYTATLIRFYAGGLDPMEAIDGLLVSALTVACLTTMSMLSMGLYIGHLREGMAGVLLRVMISLAFSSMAVGLLFYLVPDLSLWRGVLAIVYIQAFFVIGTLRTVFFELVDTSTFKSRVLVYGAGPDASFIDKKLRRKSDRRGFDVLGYVLLENQKRQVDENKVINLNESLQDYVDRNKVDEIVVASSDVETKVKIHELVACKLNGIGVLDILSFFEREAGQIRIDIVDPEWLVTTDGFRQSLLQNLIKRSFDMIVGSILLLVSLPIQVLVVIAIWLEDGIRAPIVYRQCRIGKKGRKFNVYKFRSMKSDAEKAGGAVWASKGDSRVTRTGGILRKYRLDELPQAVNVIKGDMSFVGPRPERPEFVVQLAKTIPYYNERHVLKPGLTGWAQLNYPYGSSLDDAFQKQIYDMYYVKNHSLFLDCIILLQTVEVVIFGKGAR